MSRMTAGMGTKKARNLGTNSQKRKMVGLRVRLLGNWVVSSHMTREHFNCFRLSFHCMVYMGDRNVPVSKLNKFEIKISM